MVVSQQTRDYRQEYETIWQIGRGMTEIHNVTHLLLDVIFDDSLNVADLSQYPIVVFDNVACLSGQQCEAIRQYVRDGGTVIAMMETSLYDEWGNQRDNFELADLFGVNYISTEDTVTQVIVPQTEDLKEQFGITDDPRRLENADLCVNTEFGRGYCSPEGVGGVVRPPAPMTPPEPVKPPAPSEEQVERVVQEITNRIMAALG